MRILLVDDEASALQEHLAILKTVPGHEVRVAASAQKAMEHAAALGGLDLLITDVVMSPTDGFTLRDQLTALYPGVRTVFVTGYDLGDYAERVGGAPVLVKPVDADALRGVIESADGGLCPAGAMETPGWRSAGVGSEAVAAAAGGVVATAHSGVEAITRQQAPESPMPVAGAMVDRLIGVQLGDYRVQRLLARGAWGNEYSAMQTSVNRRVGLRVLDPMAAQDERNRTRFLADAQAKAAVQHPLIMSVFEADERNGLVFFTHEFLDGTTMQERIEGRQFLDEKTALHVVKATAEGMQYLWSHNLPHGALDASVIRLGSDNIARLENIATATIDQSVTTEGEIRVLGAMMQQLVPERSRSGGFRALLERMIGRANPVISWAPVLQAVKALEPKVIPQAAAKIKEADVVAIRAREAARRAGRKAFYISMGTLVLVLLFVGYLVWKYVLPNARKLDAQVAIPAGEYSVGSPDQGRKVSLGAFEIDQYEVSIGEYAQFIEWCEKYPAREREFDHPQADRRTSHVTDEAKILIKKASIRGARAFKREGVDPGALVDMNCPMVGVSFWDAYAFAHWRGKIKEGGILRDLPTEEEWEVAARGSKAFRYPWGDSKDLRKFNSNQGYKALAPGGAKTDDGFNYWSPVDSFDGDKSGFKVRGMAGNVCEWVYRKDGNLEIALLKGGSFASDPVEMWERITKIPADDAWYVYPAAEKPKTNSPAAAGAAKQYVGDDVTQSTRSLYIGFRTVKRK